jgi:hypothetical protein
MNLWTAEETVRALVREVDPARERELGPEGFETLVNELAMDLLEQIQEVQTLNQGEPVTAPEVLEVATEAAKGSLRERLQAEKSKRPSAR